MGNFTHQNCTDAITKSIGGDDVKCEIDGSYYKVSGLSGSGIGTICDACEDCDAGLFCDLLNATPTCKNTSVESPAACMDCVDNDADALIDFAEDPGCDSLADNDETDIPVIPEFSPIGLILMVIIIGVGTVFMITKKRK